jgi:transketolase
MRVLPNMKVVVPADAIGAAESIRALIKVKGPCYLRLMRGATPVVYEDDIDFKLGKGNILRDGSDVTIVANGIMVHMALDASKQLSDKGIKTRVIDMHTVKPLDKHLIERAARETGVIITAEEHNIIGGLGGAIAETLSESYPTLIKRIGVDDIFGQSSRSYPNLLKAYRLTSESIVRTVENTIGDRSVKNVKI